MMSNPALSLNPDDHAEVIAFFRKAFSDYIEFDNFVREPLEDLLRNFRTVGVTAETTSKLLSRYSRVQDDKERSDQLKTALTACHVLLHALLEGSGFFWNDVDTLLQNYESFRVVEDAKELQLLLHFRNFMAAAVRLVPAKGNKIFLLRVIERLEGGDQVYITGTGQKPAVTRRIAIYEKEGKVAARKIKNTESSSSKKIKTCPSSSSSSSHTPSIANSPALGFTEESGLDELLAAPASNAHRFTSFSLPPPPPLPPSFSAQPSVRPVARQLSEVAPGELTLDQKSHAALLSEPYTGSFTEEIRVANISS